MRGSFALQKGPEHTFPLPHRITGSGARCPDAVASSSPWSHPAFPGHRRSRLFLAWKPPQPPPPRAPGGRHPTGGPRHAPTRFTGSLLDLGDGGQAVLQRLAAHRLQLADVVVGPAVAAAHLGAELALADPLGEALAHGVAAVEAVPAGRVLLAAAGVPLARGADEAAVAAVGDVAAGAAGAGALGDIAAGRALGSGSRELRGAGAAAEGEQEQRAQQRHPHPRRAAGGQRGGEGVRARPARGQEAEEEGREGAIAVRRGKGNSGFMHTRMGKSLLPRAGLLQAAREAAADRRKEAGV